MLTIKDFKKDKANFYVKDFGDYKIGILIEKNTARIGIGTSDGKRVIESFDVSVDCNGGELKKGQINELFLKSLKVANRFYKEFIA